MKIFNRKGGLKMKISIKIWAIMLSLICMVFFTVQAFGVEMSAEEKELWSRIEMFFEGWKNGDRKDIKLHKNFVGWSSSAKAPLGRDDYLHFIFSVPIESYTLEPVKITTTGNFCLVMYNWSIKGFWGSNAGHSISTYMKQDGKWHGMGEMSASCKKPALCAPMTQ
jgi:hypothetical protein